MAKFSSKTGRRNVSARVISSLFARDVFYDDAGSPSNVQAKAENFESRVTALEGGAAPVQAYGIIVSADGIDMQAGGALGYTVPTGKTLVILDIVVRNASATLAGGTSYDLFDGTNDIFAALNFSGVTSSTLRYHQGAAAVTETVAAGASLSLVANIGSTGAATATVEILGYLV
jgi:hypothetical protein